MGLRKYTTLELSCDKCGRKHSVDITAHPVPDTAWANGWLVVSAQVAEHDLVEKSCYCPDHATPIIQTLGYETLTTFKTTLEAQAAALKVNSPVQQWMDLLLGKEPPDKDPEGNPPIKN